MRSWPPLTQALARSGLAQKRYDEAGRYLQRALDLWQKSGGLKSRDAIVALNNLAQVHKLTGEYTKADALYRKAIATCTETAGAHNRICASFIGNYADSVRLQGRATEAARLYEEAISSLERVLPPEHPELLQLREELSELGSARQAAWTVGFRQLQRSPAP